jgi:mutator protein MutT
VKDFEISIAEGQIIKKSKLLSLFEDYIVNPAKDFFQKSEDVVKKNYADCIIRNKKGEILLLQRSYQDDFMDGKWCLPGGKIENDEQPQIAAARELEEETGITLGQLNNFSFVKTIEKDDCVINYFEAILSNNIDLFILDNDEHYRYEFVSIEKIDEYDLILDLGDVLKNELIPLFLPIYIENVKYSNVEESIVETGEDNLIVNFEEIKKAFDDGCISDEYFIKYAQSHERIERINVAFELIKSAFNNNQIDLPILLEYSKKYDEIIKANDPSHGGKLVKKTIVDKTGKKQIKWINKNEVSRNNDDAQKESGDNHGVIHSKKRFGKLCKRNSCFRIKESN